MNHLADLKEDQLLRMLYNHLDSDPIKVVKELIRREIDANLNRLEKQVKETYDVAKVQGQIANLRKFDSFLSPPSRPGAVPSQDA